MAAAYPLSASSEEVAPLVLGEDSCFDDVSPGTNYYLAICTLKQQGVIEGYDDNTFKPYQKINRAEALTIMLSASGLISDDFDINVDEDPFIDVPADAWYSKYLQKAKDEGIINGYEDQSFQPGKNINLAETLKIFLEAIPNAFFLPVDPYLVADTPRDAWFTKYTAYAISRGAVNVYNNNTINPKQEMTRGYLAEVLYRFRNYGNVYGYGKATYYGAAVQGNYTASGEIFDMYQMTAAHKTLPFNTIVEVTNLANGKSVEVRITDRGPYGPGRVIDLTSSAFQKISTLSRGVTTVEYRIVSTP